jgi:hypothetical protein
MSLLLLMGDSTPSIGSLFASGEAGLALDVETAYRRGWLYQDSAGATVSAAAGDPVGLILDTSRGGLDSLGSELVTNGGLSDATGWTLAGASPPSITGGQAVWSASTGEIQWASSLVAGRWYRLECDLTSYTSGTLAFRDGTTNTTIATTGATLGKKTFLVLATSNQIRFIAFSSATLAIDNISIREIPGNHASQTTSGSRPLLARTPDGGRRNLLTYSEQFDVTSGGWTKNAATVTANSTTAPDGTATADTITATAAFGNFNQVSSQASTTFTMSIYAKKNGFDQIELGITNNNAYGNGFAARFDLTTGLYVSQRTFGTGYTLTGYSIADAGSGWYRITCSGTISVAAAPCGWAGLTASAVNGSTVFVWGAQLETGSSVTAYQKVDLTSDVTESGKRDCWGLLFDGSDDSLVTASVDFSATDKMTVMAGVRKNVDTARATVCELTASIASNNGGFHLTAPNAASDTFAFESKGTSLTDAVATGIAAPATRVLTGIGNIAGDSASLRVNGAVADTDTGDQGTGNYANAAVFIGSRGGSSFRFNGLIYTLIVRGATTPTGTIADFEKNLLRIRAGLGPF